MVKLSKFIRYHRLKRLASINPFGNIMPGALVEKMGICRCLRPWQMTDPKLVAKFSCGKRTFFF